MILYHFFKAQPTIKDRPVESVEIHIEQEIPDSKTLEEAAETYNQQAEKLERVLYNALPGGVYDGLAAYIMARKASHFKVSYGEE
jgi:hypothetical protein